MSNNAKKYHETLRKHQLNVFWFSTTYKQWWDVLDNTVSNFADDLHWPELGILLESIDYHEAVRKASFLGSMCEDPLMAAIHFERRLDALMKYFINSQEHAIGKVKVFFYRVEFQIRGTITW